MKFKYLIKSIFLLIISKGYYVISDKGSSMMIPKDKQILEGIQDELELFDRYLEDQIMDIELSERE